jgi:hypothetical protein
MSERLKLKIGYVVLKNGDPVKTGRRGAQTAKLYQHAGRARAVTGRFNARTRTDLYYIVEAFIEVPGE